MNNETNPYPIGSLLPNGNEPNHSGIGRNAILNSGVAALSRPVGDIENRGEPAGERPQVNFNKEFFSFISRIAQNNLPKLKRAIQIYFQLMVFCWRKRTSKHRFIAIMMCISWVMICSVSVYLFIYILPYLILTFLLVLLLGNLWVWLRKKQQQNPEIQ